MAATHDRPHLQAAFVAVVAVWASELALARVSGEPQSLLDVAESLVGLCLLGVAPAVLFARWPAPGTARSVLLGLTAAVPMALVAFGILIPVLLTSAVLGACSLAALLAVLGAGRVAAAFRRDAPFPGPLAAAAVVAMASLAVWLVKDAELPPPGLLLPLLGVLLAIGLVARRAFALPLLIAGTAAFAWMPRLPVQPEWSNDAPPAAGPDIVFLLVDTLRRDSGEAMSSYRRIATEGVAFRNAQAAAPWTSPSMGTLFTGLRPPEHGALRIAGMGTGSILPEVPTLAERLYAAGYDTAAVVTSDAAGPRRGFHRGIDVMLHEGLHWSMPRARSARQARPFVARLLSMAGLQGRPESIDAPDLSVYATQILERRREDRPLFLWVHYLDPHLPYRHAEGSDVERRRSIELDNGNAVVFRRDPFWRTAAGVETIRRGYDWEVEQTDQAIHAMLDALGPPPERGRVVVLTSDHGEEFFEHGDMLHGHAFHQEVVGVPLVISGLAGRDPGSEEQAVVGHIDVMPTLLAAAGLSSDGLRGQDLAEVIEPRIYVSENLSTQPYDERRSAREGAWKLILGPGDRARLYHLGDDPEERTNVAERHPAVVARLAAALPVDAGEVVPVELTDEDHRMLEALGYVEE